MTPTRLHLQLTPSKKKRGPGKGDVIVPISHYEIEASLAVTVAVGKENSPGKVYPFARDLP
jgi:hypothetical protein